MKSNKSTRIPKLRKCNNRGFVELNGQRTYLSRWGDSSTKEAYDRTLAEWIANSRLIPVSKHEITIVDFLGIMSRIAINTTENRMVRIPHHSETYNLP